LPDFLKDDCRMLIFDENLSDGSTLAESEVIVLRGTKAGDALAVRLGIRLGRCSLTQARTITCATPVIPGSRLGCDSLIARSSRNPLSHSLSILEVVRGGFDDNLEVTYEMPVPCVLTLAYTEPSETSADFVVAVGRGVGAHNLLAIEAFAQKFDGIVMGSRAAAMKGLVPIDRIIGVSGRSIDPKVCVALAVSGSAPFLSGISEKTKLVAVNSDKSAPIFEAADMGIVGDYREVVLNF
jgi:electron transfer flavoprotein alpha subunit